MPLYEYKCKSCGHEFEKIVVTSKRDEVECTTCASPETDRQISTFAAGGNSPANSAPSAPRFT